MSERNISPDNQLESIQSMLSYGHKSIHLEKHTLILWGVGIGFLTAFTHDVSSIFYEQGHTLGRIFQISFVAIVLLAITWFDYRKTRAIRAVRDETISLVQRKVTFSIWMIFAFALLLDIYANIYLGGGRKMFGVYLVLGGIVLIMFGLYSERWYRWSGVVLILIGLVIMFMLQPSNTSRLLTASVFTAGGIGIAYLQPYAVTKVKCVWFSLLWVLGAVVLTTIVYQLDYYLDIKPDQEKVWQWSEYQQANPDGKHVVRISAGNQIPVELTVSGDVFEGKAEADLQLKVSKNIDIEFKNGKPTGIYRIDDGSWFESNDALFTRRFIRQTIVTDKQGPKLLREIEIGTQRRLGGLSGD